LLPGVDPVLLREVRSAEFAFLADPGPNGAGNPPMGASAVLQCSIPLQVTQPLDPAEMAALAAGLSLQLDGVAEVAEGQVVTPVFRGLVPLLTATGSKDPVTQVRSMRLSRIEMAGQAVEAQQLVLSFVVWRMVLQS